MTLPPIPASVRTSAAGFIAALCGWIAIAPGVHPYVAAACAALSAAATGAGLHLAADHRALKAAARTCPICGYAPNGPPPDGKPSAAP